MQKLSVSLDLWVLQLSRFTELSENHKSYMTSCHNHIYTYWRLNKKRAKMHRVKNSFTPDLHAELTSHSLYSGVTLTES